MNGNALNGHQSCQQTTRDWQEQVERFRASVSLYQSAMLRFARRNAHQDLPPIPRRAAHPAALVDARLTELPVPVSEPEPAAAEPASPEKAGRVLTPRQVEVAGLIAKGYTNAQIAEQLVITEGTTANLVRQILQRLDARNRAQIAAWAIENLSHARAH